MERIFLEAAQRNMINFNVESFKKTHPKLYATILDALIVVSQENEKAISDKFVNSLPTPSELKVVVNGVYKSNCLVTNCAKSSFIKGAIMVLKIIENNLNK